MRQWGARGQRRSRAAERNSDWCFNSWSIASLLRYNKLKCQAKLWLIRGDIQIHYYQPWEGQRLKGLQQLDGDHPANWQLDLCTIKGIFPARCFCLSLWRRPERFRQAGDKVSASWCCYEENKTHKNVFVWIFYSAVLNCVLPAVIYFLGGIQYLEENAAVCTEVYFYSVMFTFGKRNVS